MKKISALLFIVIFSGTLSAHYFRFHDAKGLTFKEETLLEQKIYYNKKYIKTTKIKSVLTANQIKKSGNRATYKGKIEYFTANSDGSYDKEAERKVSFSRDIYGNTRALSGKSYIPRKHFPRFSRRNLTKNQKWSAPVVETFNLRPLGIDTKIKIKTRAQYIYVRDQNIDGYKTAVIMYYYSFNDKKLSNKHCAVISGDIVGILFWDKESNMPYRYSESYNTTFKTPKGFSISCNGYTDKTVYLVTSKTKRKFKLRDDIDKSLGKGEQMRISKQGVVLNLGNILFDTGKSIIKLGSINKLVKIAEFLQQRKNIKIRIEGHTDNQGKRYYNMRLSRMRALSVYRFFTLQANISRYRVTFKGWGSTKPIASNAGKKIDVLKLFFTINKIYLLLSSRIQ